MIPYVSFHNFDIFTILLQCRKKKKKKKTTCEWVGVLKPLTGRECVLDIYLCGLTLTKGIVEALSNRGVPTLSHLVWIESSGLCLGLSITIGRPISYSPWAGSYTGPLHGWVRAIKNKTLESANIVHFSKTNTPTPLCTCSIFCRCVTKQGNADWCVYSVSLP